MSNDPQINSCQKTCKEVFSGCTSLLVVAICLALFFSFLLYFYPIISIETETIKRIVSLEVIFSGYTALFSGLAFIGIIISIFLQRSDLNLQKLEMKAARKEYTIKRITEIIYKQVEIIDKTFMKLPYWHLKIEFGPTEDDFRNGTKAARYYDPHTIYPITRLIFKTGLDGIYPFNDRFKNVANAIQEGKNIDIIIEKHSRDCLINNYTSMKHLGAIIVSSIEIIEGLFNDNKDLTEKSKLFEIFQVSIGQEILIFFKITYIIANKLVSASQTENLIDEDHNLETIKEIKLFCDNFILSFQKIDNNFSEFLKSEIS